MGLIESTVLNGFLKMFFCIKILVHPPTVGGSEDQVFRLSICPSVVRRGVIGFACQTLSIDFISLATVVQSSGTRHIFANSNDDFI